MRQTTRFACLTLTALLVLLAALTRQPVAASEHGLPTWLVGCWVSDNGESLEAWTQDTDSTLIGFSSIVKDNRVVFYELMSIHSDSGAPLVFTAYPSNQPGGSFDAISQTEDSVVFQNPAHDFPQRIRYQRSGNQLIADIALASGDKQIDFLKTQCTD
ncbi:MAG: DUF6265 family protein [Pseudomonadota bacterium]